VGIQALEQAWTTVALTATHIMTSGDQVGTEHLCVVEKDFELDFAVAQDVGIGRAPRFVFSEEMFEDIVPVFSREIGRMQFDAELVAHSLSVRQVFLGGTIFSAVVLVPVLHEQAFYFVALFKQAQGRDGGVDTAGHADDDFAGGRGHSNSLIAILYKRSL